MAWRSLRFVWALESGRSESLALMLCLVRTASPSIAGSRPGALIAGTWAALMHVGVRGYVESCREIVGATKRLEQLIRAEIPELKVMGKPLVSVIAFEAKEGSGLSIYGVGDVMSKKGWHRASLVIAVPSSASGPT